LPEKIRRLTELLKEFTLEDIERIESSDRQFRALEELFRELKNPREFLKLVVINALLSYQLQMKGEEYWEAFSEFFKKRSLEAFPRFLSLYNRRFLGARLRRFERVKRCVEELFDRFSVDEIGKNLFILVDFLSECLGQKRDAKTVVFAAKMFMYGYKIAFGRYPRGLDRIEIPLDSRLKRIIPDVRQWRELSEKVGIPPLRLDGLIWVSVGGESSIPPSLKEKVERLKRALKGP